MSLSRALKGTRWLVVDSAGCADEHYQQGQAYAVAHNHRATAAAARAIVRELRQAAVRFDASMSSVYSSGN